MTRILFQISEDLRLSIICSMVEGNIRLDDVKWCTYRLDAIESCSAQAVLVGVGAGYIGREGEHLPLGHASKTGLISYREIGYRRVRRFAPA